ncbi:MAG: aldo/keto reductase [Alphaproteobacteria bacterium]|jgi:aryl-alcohol dehydrogenase-like predicted oxidoreductase|nr:aldo/keto reductase [Rhodospirillaceae bacterium]MDG2479729.1 aldo/keto reductase [Alphaproteobacteria bacterium]MBT6205721.1 aldo/keto reductase [Rhodospirillaceae bacterium]MBT6509497.1 aldo/keto reductase [Rhodospirillaceae bacterium]MBT7612955.1 aldo/keto reductase [Rhodospirillaceae bacterium]
MEYRTFGQSGLFVSLAGMGCNTLGWWVGEAQGKKVVHAALDAGIALFDTADMYDDGTSERILGKALGAKRKDVTVVTKFGMKKGKDQRDIPRGSREYIIRSCEGSLKRLGTDYIDLYLHHEPDPRTPIAETLDALDRLIDQGKIRYAGCSNYAGWQIADASWLAGSNSMPNFVAAQNEWNLFSRGVEAEVMPAAEHFGLGVMPYFPLAMGLLSGKYTRGKRPAKSTRLGSGEERHNGMFCDANFDRMDALDAYAAERGYSLLELAIGWLASHEVVSTVICGATKPAQVKANAAAVTSWCMTPDEIDEIGDIVGK